ncbi:MAG TPA: LuxR C-terminal-related transcriptional regulator [Williamwhitmania sp.]|nr:LuxR C-terminal-related transcriptional regulator [Williamwhitmania sp.]
MNLPAGLCDNNLEVFMHEGILKASFDGKIQLFDDLPEDIKTIFLDYMLENPTAIKSMHSMGKSDINEMLIQYVSCRFGGFDNNPDLNPETQKLLPEYWDCGHRNACPFEGKICEMVKVGDTYLTKREIMVIQEIALGFPDKNAADKLHISELTFVVHKRNIYAKMGINSKTELVTFAIKNNIVSL